MDDEAATAIGMPGLFGMGNLRICYFHNLRADWLGDEGVIADFRCEFRGLNLKGDVLTCSGTVTGADAVDGITTETVELAVTNQDDVDTTPGTATVVRFDAGKAAMLPEPAVTPASSKAAVG